MSATVENHAVKHFDLSLSVTDKSVDLTVYALTDHRRTLMDLMLEDMKRGEYKNAFAYYQEIETINELLNTVIDKLSHMAEANYEAAGIASNKAGFYRTQDIIASGESDAYKRFLKQVDPDYQQ